MKSRVQHSERRLGAVRIALAMGLVPAVVVKDHPHVQPALAAGAGSRAAKPVERGVFSMACCLPPSTVYFF
jgi:hypothetical protein